MEEPYPKICPRKQGARARLEAGFEASCSSYVLLKFTIVGLVWADPCELLVRPERLVCGTWHRSLEKRKYSLFDCEGLQSSILKSKPVAV